MSDDFLTDPELCKLLHVTTRTTMRWRRTEAGPPFVRAGLRRVLYRRSDVNEWLAARTFQTQPA